MPSSPLLSSMRPTAGQEGNPSALLATKKLLARCTCCSTDCAHIGPTMLPCCDAFFANRSSLQKSCIAESLVTDATDCLGCRTAGLCTTAVGWHVQPQPGAAAAPYLAAELAEVLGVLADLHLLDLLTETRSIASSVLAHNANLLGALGLQQTGSSNPPGESAGHPTAKHRHNVCISLDQRHWNYVRDANNEEQQVRDGRAQPSAIAPHHLGWLL
jgi:hypothetical protein